MAEKKLKPKVYRAIDRCYLNERFYYPGDKVEDYDGPASKALVPWESPDESGKFDLDNAVKNMEIGTGGEKKSEK